MFRRFQVRIINGFTYRIGRHQVDRWDPVLDRWCNVDRTAESRRTALHRAHLDAYRRRTNP